MAAVRTRPNARGRQQAGSQRTNNATAQNLLLSSVSLLASKHFSSFWTTSWSRALSFFLFLVVNDGSKIINGKKKNDGSNATSDNPIFLFSYRYSQYDEYQR